MAFRTVVSRESKTALFCGRQRQCRIGRRDNDKRCEKSQSCQVVLPKGNSNTSEQNPDGLDLHQGRYLRSSGHANKRFSDMVRVFEMLAEMKNREDPLKCVDPDKVTQGANNQYRSEPIDRGRLSLDEFINSAVSLWLGINVDFA